MPQIKAKIASSSIFAVTVLDDGLLVTSTPMLEGAPAPAGSGVAPVYADANRRINQTFASGREFGDWLDANLREPRPAEAALTFTVEAAEEVK